MKAKIFIPIAVVAAIAALIVGYVQMSGERKAEAVADQPVTATSRMHTGANGGTVVTLNPKTRELIGLETVTLTAATRPPGIPAGGRVLDPAALIALQSQVTAAQAALQASQREYERSKDLSTQENVSARILETAEAAMKHDQAALDTAVAQLVAATDETIARQPPDFFQSLSRQENVLVRFDVPASEAPVEMPAAAQVRLPGAEPAVAADFLGRAAAADPQVQGAGFLFVIRHAPPALTPGLAVSGILQLPGEPRPGVIVPEAAVVRSEERAWIYVETGDNTFVRREMVCDQPAAGGWFVTRGVAAGDKVVVTGAQTLLSEEHKTEIRMGD